MKAEEMDELLGEMLRVEAYYQELLARCHEMGPAIVRAWREARGWSQSRMAREIGLDSTYVSRVERGLMPISKQIMRILYEADHPPEQAV
jgi:ribosome-binding protein aMBF1 (putative translation factor)